MGQFKYESELVISPSYWLSNCNYYKPPCVYLGAGADTEKLCLQRTYFGFFFFFFIIITTADHYHHFERIYEIINLKRECLFGLMCSIFGYFVPGCFGPVLRQSIRVGLQAEGAAHFRKARRWKMVQSDAVIVFPLNTPRHTHTLIWLCPSRLHLLKIMPYPKSLQKSDEDLNIWDFGRRSLRGHTCSRGFP